MIEEPGTVVGLDEQFIWIETVRLSSCSACSAQSGCGQAVLGKLIDQQKQGQKNLVRLPRTENTSIEIGQSVILGIPEDALIRASFLAYGVPVSALLVGAGVAQALGWSDLMVAAAAIVSLAGSLFWVNKKSRRWACQFKYRPQISNRIHTVNTESGNL